LSYLQQNLSEPVPQAVWQRLKAMPVSKWEQAEYRLRNSKSTICSKFWTIWFNYSRQTGELPLHQKITRFPQYLRDFWRLEHLWQVPFQAYSAVLSHSRQSFSN
jgi:hypothetical protein